MKKLLFLIQLVLIIAASDSMSQSNWQFTLTQTGGYTIYDLASSSSPQWIVQDPAAPENIHAILMASPLGDPSPSFSGRRTAYYFSSDRGATWAFTGNILNSKTGFPCLTVASDGSAIVTQHGATGMVVNSLVYKDAAAGLGSFSQLGSSIGNMMFGRVIATANWNLPVKVVFLGSPFATDSVVRSTFNGTSWSSNIPVTNSTPEAYVLARGNDGRIGVAYIDRNFNPGSVYFMESTNNGLNFSSPLRIFQPNPADSLSAYRGISMAYKNNSACITFEIANQEASAEYLIKAPAKIMFWNPQLPGTDPDRSIAVAHKNNVWIPSPDSIKTGVNDQFTTLCRPVVGISSDNNIIYVVFQAFTNKWGGSTDTTNFKALYITRAESNYNFSPPVKITPESPLRDWSYPSISPWNEKSGLSDYAYICALSDSTPGTYANSTSNGQSEAKFYFIKAKYIEVGITKINETAESFNLYQNYPNPFNPVTTIEFSVPKAGNVSLRIYDMNGREASVPLNGNRLQPGKYSQSVNGAGLSSGVYFYSLIFEGKVIDTKKMILLK
ncbi:MAG: T9SS type A sorting domain-containing protein [Ignavibacteria bacterium]|jgi:hypothetical protein|nr:T9SS type A sorting domain-containing protein [Ignavibacteria bacterium]